MMTLDKDDSPKKVFKIVKTPLVSFIEQIESQSKGNAFSTTKTKRKKGGGRNAKKNKNKDKKKQGEYYYQKKVTN
jgi:hypothetical protein